LILKRSKLDHSDAYPGGRFSLYLGGPGWKTLPYSPLRIFFTGLSLARELSAKENSSPENSELEKIFCESGKFFARMTLRQIIIRWRYFL
jgi:hypothetical protein